MCLHFPVLLSRLVAKGGELRQGSKHKQYSEIQTKNKNKIKTGTVKKNKPIIGGKEDGECGSLPALRVSDPFSGCYNYHGKARGMEVMVELDGPLTMAELVDGKTEAIREEVEAMVELEEWRTRAKPEGQRAEV